MDRADPPVPKSEDDLHVDAVLYPHRSLGASQFLVLMAAIAGVSFVAGMIFAVHGAWPVLGFFGLDVLAIYCAFRISFRRARRREIVQLSDDCLRIASIDASGRRRHWEFQPYWVQLGRHEDAAGRGHLVLRSHGRTILFGSFLTSEERGSLESTLRAALARLRLPPTAAAD